MYRSLVPPIKKRRQREKDHKLYTAAALYKWDEVEQLLNEGATPDYIKEDGRTAYYNTFLWAKGTNDPVVEKVLKTFDQKWKDEIDPLN